MSDTRLSLLPTITQADVNDSTLLYCVDTSGNTSQKVTRQNLYLNVANNFIRGQSINPVLETSLTLTPPSGPVGSSSPFIGCVNSIAGTTTFTTTAQTGEFIGNKFDQTTLAFASGTNTITNATTVKIVGAPIGSTHETITNAYALWVAAGISKFDGTFSFTSTGTFAGAVTFSPSTATAITVNLPTAPVGSSSIFPGGRTVVTGTIGFITTPQTGDYHTDFIGQATLTNPSAGVITNATTLKVLGAPIAGSNVTITNAYALWVAGGNSQFDGVTTFSSILSVSGTNSLFEVSPATAPTGISGQAVVGQVLLDGTTGFITTPQTGDVVYAHFRQVTLTNPSTGTVPNATTLKINGPPVASTNVTITNAYSLWVLSGNSLFGGNVGIAGNAITTTTYTITEVAAGAGVTPVLSIKATTGNQAAGFALTPVGTSHSVQYIFSRVNALTGSPQFGFIGTDYQVTGEYALVASSVGTALPLNVYQVNTKLMSFNTANTITSYVPFSISSGTITPLSLTGTTQAQVLLTSSSGTAGGQIISQLSSYGLNSSSANTEYVNVYSVAEITTAGSEAGQYVIQAKISGSMANFIILDGQSSYIGLEQQTSFLKTIFQYNGINTAGTGVGPIYGIDNRTGRTSADGAPITLYAVPGTTGLFRVALDIFATAYTSGTATYTLTWTENGGTRTTAITATVLNTLGNASVLIRPDASTNITVQLTGTFTATLNVGAVVEQLA